MPSPTYAIELGLGGHYDDAVLADSPLGFWRLGETSGIVAADASGHGRDGTYTGGPVLGVVGALPENNPAITLDGIGAYVDMGDVAAFEFTTAFTLEIWAAFFITSSQAVIMSKCDNGGAGWAFLLNLNGTVRFFGLTVLGAAVFDISTTVAVNDGHYHHFVCRWDGTTSANGVTIWVDGVVAKQGTAVAGTIDTNSSHFVLGTFGNRTSQFFAGMLDEAAVYSGALSNARIAEHYAAGAWSDVTTDVIAARGVSWARGLTRNASPTDRTARPGQLSFELRNDVGNSGGVLGYYSPSNANVRSGFTTGIPVRVRATYAGTSYPLWTGRLRSIRPTPGQKRTRNTLCTAQDAFGDFTEASVREIDPQVGQNEAALIQAVFDALPIEAFPLAVDIDAGLDSYTYALDNIGAGTRAIGLLNDIAVSAFGLIYGKADGTVVYSNRYSRIAASSAFTFNTDTAGGDDIDVPDSLANVFNRVRVTAHPKTVTASTLYQSTGSIAIGAGQTVTVWGTYSDPSNPDRLIGGLNFIDPLVAGTDYIGNAAPDVSGAVLTDYLSVTVTPFATTAKFEITNSFTSTVYATTLQLRGDGLFDNAPQVYESFIPMAYGDRPIDIDLAYQDDGNVAQDFADYQALLLSDPTQVSAVSFYADRSTTLLTQALTREIGDVITLSEIVTGITSVDAVILGVSMEIRNMAVLRVTWILGPQANVTALIMDDPIYGVLDSPEAVLGYA